MALVFLLMGASWQGIVNAHIERNTWSLPKYAAVRASVPNLTLSEATEAYAFVGTMNLV